MFSDYLKNMTSNKNFLEELQDSKKLEENFKDLYSSIELTDVFESNIKYVKESASKNSNYSIKHTDAKSVLLSIFSSNGGKESVTLKMDKAQILKALEKGSVVFTYKIKVDTPAKFTTKSSKKSLNKSSKIVSSSLSYKINEKNGKKVNLGEVKLKGAMVTRPMPAPVPPVPPVVKPEQPSVPPTEGPTPPPVKPELPSKPDVPSLPTPQPVPPSEPGEPIAPGESDVPSAPEVPQEPEIPSEPQVPSEPEVHTNSQHIELEFNNQFPSISGNNSSILNSEGSDTTIEDTMPEKESHSDVHISGGNVIDIDMSTNPDMLGHHTDMSGDNSSIIKLYGQDKDGNIMEDTRPQVDIEIGGGQIIDIDISTSPDMIGHNTDMSGDNSDIIKLYGQDKDGTIIEDTLPEMPQESENPQVSETPKATDIFAKAPAHHTPALPATGDDNVSNFTAMLVGLGLISTAGWYGKKKRQEKN